MSLFLYIEKLGFCSDIYLPLGPKSRFLLFIFYDVVPKDDDNFLYPNGLICAADSGQIKSFTKTVIYY